MAVSRRLWTVDFKEAESPARAAALKAIGLDEQLAEAHISLGNIKQHYDWDWTGSEQEFRRALELDPGSLDVHHTMAPYSCIWGDMTKRSGKARSPCNWIRCRRRLVSFGRFLYRARKYKEALPHLQRAVELEPQSITRITAWAMSTRNWAGMMKRLPHMRKTESDV